MCFNSPKTMAPHSLKSKVLGGGVICKGHHYLTIALLFYLIFHFFLSAVSECLNFLVTVFKNSCNPLLQ